jgi:hypothetical protein
MAKFSGIVHLLESLDPNGGIGVFPARLWLELVEKSHKAVAEP